MLLETIYKATKGGKVQEWTIEVVKNRYRTISGQTDGKKVVSEWTSVFGKNEGKANATTDNEQAVKEAEAKRCIVTIDGMFSRNGKEIISAPHIRESLDKLFQHEPDLILDGELYADKFANDFNAIVSLVKKTKPTADDLKQSAKNIEYHVYDVPSVDGTFKERCIELDELSLDFPKCVKQVETHIVKNESEVTDWYENYVERGYEGQMLRTDGVYENKRSKNLLKHKSFIDEEYTIIDICEGEGNRAGTAGYFVFETADGKPFKSNVKGTWEETAEMLKNRKKLIGKEATVKYFNLTPDGIPRFPYVISIDRNSYE